jgi:hypothetical protein
MASARTLPGLVPGMEGLEAIEKIYAAQRVLAELTRE